MAVISSVRAVVLKVDTTALWKPLGKSGGGGWGGGGAVKKKRGIRTSGMSKKKKSLGVVYMALRSERATA